MSMRDAEQYHEDRIRRADEADRISELEAEVARLRAILARYADEDNWYQYLHKPDVWTGDDGAGYELAQAALATPEA